jgi:hypothetical protein
MPVPCSLPCPQICGSAHETGQRVRDYRDTWRALEDVGRSRFPQARGPVVSRWSGEVGVRVRRGGKEGSAVSMLLGLQ